MPRDTTYYWADFKATLRNADGEQVAYNQALLKASRDESASGKLARGEEARVRFYFELPATVGGDSLLLTA